MESLDGGALERVLLFVNAHTVGSESFPCLACYLHLGFNKEGARIHFSVSYIIIWDALIFH